MLVLDTNTFYYISGLSKSLHINYNTFFNSISTDETIVISSVTFGEFVSKYRKHARIIRRMCSFMRQHHITIADQTIPFDNEIISKLRKIKQYDLKSVNQTLRLAKVNTESKYGTVVFCIILFCETIFECQIDPYNVPDCIYDFFSKLFKNTLRPILVDLFKSIYFEAYKTDDAENVIRKDFYNYLKLFISLCIPLSKHVMDVYNKLPIGAKVDVMKIINEYPQSNWTDEMGQYQKKITREMTSAKFVQKAGLKYGKGINDKQLSSLLNGLSNSLKKVIPNSTIEEYLFTIISNTISNGGAFCKNDINDALILSIVGSQDRILSFDKGMQAHLRKYSDAKVEYKNSLLLISTFVP